MNIREEQMAPFFTKFHLEGLPFAAVIHRFTQDDAGGDFHDHPWLFRSTILRGGYLEEVVDVHTGAVSHRLHTEGDSFVVQAGHVHRIVKLLAPECWTMIMPGQHERKPGFYRWQDGRPLHRFWDQQEWTDIGERIAA